MFWLQKQRDITFDFSITWRTLLWVFLKAPAEVKAESSKLELVVLTHHHVHTGSWACLLAWGKEVPSQSLLNFPALDSQNAVRLYRRTAGMQGGRVQVGILWIGRLAESVVQILLVIAKYV